jgi:antirestriction protein ArdC
MSKIISENNMNTLIDGFKAIGIPEEEVIPTVNVFSYDAWRELGRQVMKGEKGVAIVAWRDTLDQTTGETARRPFKDYRFHVSQTKSLEEQESTENEDE